MISVKHMKLTISATLLAIAGLGLVGQANAFNPQDLELLKTTRSCPRCDLSGVDLTQVNLEGVVLREANLRGAKLEGSNLRNADLTGVNMEGAVLNNTNLQRASLTGAILKSTSFENADLSFASLMSANLEGANFKGAKLQMTNFRGAYFRLTTMPSTVVTSDKPYGWSLQREQKRDCDRFRLENTPGTVCATEIEGRLDR